MVQDFRRGTRVTWKVVSDDQRELLARLDLSLNVGKAETDGDYDRDGSYPGSVGR